MTATKCFALPLHVLYIINVQKSFQQPYLSQTPEYPHREDRTQDLSKYVCVCPCQQDTLVARDPLDYPRRSFRVSSSGSSNGDLTLIGSSNDDRGLITYSAGPVLLRAGLASYTLALLEYSVLANDL
jgi:hypothetical protein